MMKTNDLTGKTFGRLKVLNINGMNKFCKTIYLVQCSCNSKPFNVVGGSLTSGNTQSCGCFANELTSQRSTKCICGVCGKTTTHRYHTLVVHKECKGLYKSYESMCYRCGSVSCQNWFRYGGRGVIICDRWHPDNPEGRQNFYTDAFQNGWYSGLHPHRILPDGNYTPENIKWLTPHEHAKEHVRLRRLELIKLREFYDMHK